MKPVILTIFCTILLMVSGCISSKSTYMFDEAGNPKLVVENHNLIRVGATAQIATLNPETSTIALTQVTAADSMSNNLTAAWSRLMDIAGYAIGGAAVSAAASGPTTPAAVAGGLIGYVKSKVAESRKLEGEKCENDNKDEQEEIKDILGGKVYP